MGCVTTSKYALIINGVPNFLFKGRRGIRQGDPGIFALHMEYMSKTMSYISNLDEYTYVMGTKITYGMVVMTHESNRPDSAA